MNVSIGVPVAIGGCLLLLAGSLLGLYVCRLRRAAYALPVVMEGDKLSKAEQNGEKTGQAAEDEENPAPHAARFSNMNPLNTDATLSSDGDNGSSQPRRGPPGADADPDSDRGRWDALRRGTLSSSDVVDTADARSMTSAASSKGSSNSSRMRWTRMRSRWRTALRGPGGSALKQPRYNCFLSARARARHTHWIPPHTLDSPQPASSALAWQPSSRLILHFPSAGPQLLQPEPLSYCTGYCTVTLAPRPAAAAVPTRGAGDRVVD